MARQKVKRALWVLPFLIPALLAIGALLAEGQLPGRFPVGLRPGQITQNTLQVDNSTTPNRTQIGCEVEQVGGATVQGIRMYGASAGNPPTIEALACTGADSNINLRLAPVAGGRILLSGPVTLSSPTTLGDGGTAIGVFRHGTCSLTAPTALLASSADAASSVPCTATGIISTDRVWVAPFPGLENGLVLKAWSAGTGSIVLTFRCTLSSAACAATMGTGAYTWQAITP